MDSEPPSGTVLFADVCDSTRLYDALGDAEAKRVLLECLDAMEAIVDGAGGCVIDRIGDEVMCTFTNPSAAGRAACSLHQAFDPQRGGAPRPVAIRVGFHHGPLLREAERIFGETIHVARRVASAAKAQQTLLSGQARKLIPVEAHLAIRFVDRTHLRGKAEPYDLFEIVWEGAEATLSAHTTEQDTGVLQPPSELVLESQGVEHTLDSMHPTLSIGRDPRVDVVVDHDRVSRLHARIEYRRGSFVFVDQSRNGSHIVDESGAEQTVRRDEAVLGGWGWIVLGSRRDGGDLPRLSYRVR